MFAFTKSKLFFWSNYKIITKSTKKLWAQPNPMGQMSQFLLGRAKLDGSTFMLGDW